MKKLKKILSILILNVTILCNFTFASEYEMIDNIENVEYSESFKIWQELPENEKNESLMPRTFDIINTEYKSNNPLNVATNVGNNLESKFSLESSIPKNLSIRNQMQTNSCWAFASLGALETNLALADFKNGNTSTVYDFSERHMEYATSKIFKNNQVNKDGLNRKVGDGGNVNISRAYLTNGTGAVLESAMPFENNEDLIDISLIKNRKVETRVYDTVDFPNSKTATSISDLQTSMKNHIKQYGGIEAGVFGANILSDYYNNDTGALYCDNATKCVINHDVIIIGWDDNYSKNNFVSAHRPKNNGAWIIRNSWGTKQEYNLTEMKEVIFKKFESECKKNGWNSPSQIPDPVALGTFEENGYKIENNKAVLTVGDNGKMYVSYEDCNIYTSLYGFESATTDVSYDKIYQYDFYGPTSVIQCNSNSVYYGNVFDRDKNSEEYLTEVALYAPETYTCSVLVNSSSGELKTSSLKSVELKAGASETVSAGYHTLELAEPIKLTGDKFAVVVKATGTESTLIMSLETPIDNTPFDELKIESDKCFFTFGDYYNKDSWVDLSKLEEFSNGSLPNSDSNIKAFTTSNNTTVKLTGIEIKNPPTKTKYSAGEDFNKDGMKVAANYANGTSKEITNYTIIDGKNLKEGQTEVTIEYNGKKAKQKITVSSTGTTPKKAESSDLSNIKCNVNKVKAYFYTDTKIQQYITMDIEIAGIQRKGNNDAYTYYYYLSSKTTEKNITKWIEIKDVDEETGNLSFVINTKNLSNFSELAKANNLYLYIKEEVINGSDMKDSISKPLLVTASSDKYDRYVDDELQNDNGNDNNNQNNGNNSDDSNNGGNNNGSNNENSNGDNSSYGGDNNNFGNGNSNNGNDDSENNDRSNNGQNSESDQDYNNQYQQPDDTTANSILPKTGLTITLFLLMLGISLYGIVNYIKYRKMGF